MKDWIIRFWMPIVLIICGIIAIVRIRKAIREDNRDWWEE